jgi:aconitate hydratase
MGAEIGATTSIFGYDTKMDEYLRGTGRATVADMAGKLQPYLPLMRCLPESGL